MDGVTMQATPTINNLPLRAGDFSTLPEALNFMMGAANYPPFCHFQNCMMTLKRWLND
jgi:hypothetical protein